MAEVRSRDAMKTATWLTLMLAGLALAVAAGCASPPPSDDDSDGGGNNNHDEDGGGQTGCNGNGSAAQPFGSHGHELAAGVILPDRPQAELDQAVRNAYDAWKASYLRFGCGDGRAYVATGHEGSLTVSEAHGYGMIISAYLAGHDGEARTIFDALYRYYADHPSSITSGLMAWSQGGDCRNNQGDNSAADGDLDIAYALLLADKQWGSGGSIDYQAEALRVIDAIWWGEVDSGGSYVRLGDWTDPSSVETYDATRTSDFMPGHLDSFAAASGDGGWIEVRDRGYTMIASLQEEYAPNTGLLPDFVLHPADDPQPAYAFFLENAADGDYGYNACRDPWRIGTHFVTTGETRARATVLRMNEFARSVTGGDPHALRAGYTLGGSPLGNYESMAFTAPFGVAAMADPAHQDWLDAIWDAVAYSGEWGYYDDSLKLLSLIVMSGNWWTPEDVPCPQ